MTDKEHLELIEAIEVMADAIKEINQRLDTIHTVLESQKKINEGMLEFVKTISDCQIVAKARGAWL